MGTKMLQTPAAKRPDVEKKLEDMTSNYKHFFPALHVRIRAARGAAGMTPKSVSQSILLLCTIPDGMKGVFTSRKIGEKLL
jgi:hypothetical protein